MRRGIVSTVPILTVALPFIRPGGAYVVLLGLVLTLALLGICVWPHEREIARTEQALESAGVPSQLRDALRLPTRQIS